MSERVVHYNNAFSEKWIRDLSPAAWRGRASVEFVEVPLSRLEHAGCWTDADVVSGWVETLNHGRTIPPPIAVLTERGTYYLHDGNHRYLALQQFLATDSECMVRVAVAVPNEGFRFNYRWFGDYGTYVLEECPRRFATAARLGTAVLASLAALITTALIPGIHEAPIFALFVVSVMIAAWAGQWKAGVLSTFINLAGAAYFFLPPDGSLFVSKPVHAVHLVLTGFLMLAVTLFMQIVRRHPSIELGLPGKSGAELNTSVKAVS